MKSTDLYREAATVLTPWMRAHGYKRYAGRVLRHYKPLEDTFFVISLGSNKYGYSDLLGGGEFFVSLQIVDRLSGDRFDVHPQPMEQLNGLLCEERLEEVRAIQNQVIAKLTPPSLDDERLLAIQRLGGGTPEGILRRFYQPRTEPYPLGQGAWFRYTDADDIHRWVEFVIEVLPEAITQFLQAHGVNAQETPAS